MSTVQGRLRIAVQKSGRLADRSLDLIRDAEGDVVGVMALEMETGDVMILEAKTTIFATGGAGRIERRRRCVGLGRTETVGRKKGEAGPWRRRLCLGHGYASPQASIFGSSAPLA